MSINIFLNQGFFIAACCMFLVYVGGKHKAGFATTYFYSCLSLSVAFIVGILIALLVGINRGNPAAEMHTDISRAVVFPLSLIFAGFMSQANNLRKTEDIGCLLVAVYMAALLGAALFGAKSLGPFGHIVKLSTVQLYGASLLGYVGMYLLANDCHKGLARFIILASWSIAVTSLAKWNFFAVLVFPFLWLAIETKGARTRKRVKLYMLLLGLLIVAFISFQDNIVQSPLVGEAWEDWGSYWNTRVAKADPSGGRFRIWGDLLQQFSESPIFGLGVGARAKFVNVEAHSMYIFLLTAFGIPLFCILVVLSVKLLMQMLRHRGLDRANHLILLTLLSHFLLLAAIGTSYGQLLIGLIVGGICGIILNRSNTRVANGEGR